MLHFYCVHLVLRREKGDSTLILNSFEGSKAPRKKIFGAVLRMPAWLKYRWGWYCWWKKSWATCYLWSPLKNGIFSNWCRIPSSNSITTPLERSWNRPSEHLHIPSQTQQTCSSSNFLSSSPWIVLRLEPWKKRTEEVQEAFQKESPVR